jgi:hypothetical protein
LGGGDGVVGGFPGSEHFPYGIIMLEIEQKIVSMLSADVRKKNLTKYFTFARRQNQGDHLYNPYFTIPHE